MLYAIQEQAIEVVPAGCLKIGQKRFDSPPRLSNLQTGNPRKLELIGEMYGDQVSEKLLHKKFAPYHVFGEWYMPAPEILEYFRLYGLT